VRRRLIHHSKIFPESIGVFSLHFTSLFNAGREISSNDDYNIYTLFWKSIFKISDNIVEKLNLFKYLVGVFILNVKMIYFTENVSGREFNKLRLFDQF